MIASDGAPADLTAANLLLTSSGLDAWRNQVVNVTPRATSNGRCAVGVNLLEARTAWALTCGIPAARLTTAAPLHATDETRHSGGQKETEDFGAAQDRSRSTPNAKDLGRLLQGKTGRIP